MVAMFQNSENFMFHNSIFQKVKSEKRKAKSESESESENANASSKMCQVSSVGICDIKKKLNFFTIFFNPYQHPPLRTEEDDDDALKKIEKKN